jgi:hypothetical protein
LADARDLHGKQGEPQIPWVQSSDAIVVEEAPTPGRGFFAPTRAGRE